MAENTQHDDGLRSYPWKGRYATSQMRIGGPPVDVLHDFYIPILERSTRYDRVAGYFTSSSLAAASQGFSRFVARGGKARFIVGSEMRFDDVKTILDLTQDRLEQSLLKKLDESRSWPVEVLNGVELLAWMVRHEHLEIRVGVRTHQDDRTLCAWEYSGDGYLHEKWAIFSDGEDEMLVSGSLNESETALSINAENLTLQPGWLEWNAQAVEECRQSFHALWQNEHPAIQVYQLPDAVKKRLIKFADRSEGYREIDGTPAELPVPHVPKVPEIKPGARDRIAFAFLRLGPLLPNGEYVGMETAPVTPWPHQRFVARRLIETYPDNYLLCDEVGLGKTIEAGLAFRSLLLSGAVDTCRVFAPASLTAQWMHEMGEKFLLPFRRRLNRSGAGQVVDFLHGTVQPTGGKLFDFPLEIISTGLITNPGPAPVLENMPETDIVILDEAHKARRESPDRTDRDPSYNRLFRELNRAIYPRSRALLLATATPMQLNEVEAFDLVKLMPAAGTVQFNEDLCGLFYRLRSKMLDHTLLEEYELKWLQRYLKNVEVTAPSQWSLAMDHVLEWPHDQTLTNFIKYGQDPVDWDGIQPALSLLAPLGRTMLRHNRRLLREYQNSGLLNENLAFRHVRPVVVPLQGEERIFYDELQAYCSELSEQIGANADDTRSRAAVGFYLSFLRLRFASSFYALQKSLERRLEKIERTLNHLAQDLDWDIEDGLDELEDDQAVRLVLKNRTAADLTWEQGAVAQLLGRCKRLRRVPEKTEKLLQEIEARRIERGSRVRQVVIFTRYKDTLDDLHGVLTQRLRDCPIGTFSGDGGTLRAAGAACAGALDRTELRQRFMAGEIDILMCTDAAAEGVNLQSADLLVNFDLPWNPMLLEQRIGRIDRIGQHHKDIHVHNYLYQQSVEEVVYVRLVHRFRQAVEIAGELQFSLLPIQQQDFEDFAKSPSEPDWIDENELIARAERHASAIRRRMALIDFDARRQRQIYEELESQASLEALPVTLEKIWKVLSESEYLGRLGCQVRTFAEGSALELNGIPEISDGTLLTASRELYDRGLPRSDQRTLRFASYGDPVFESLLSHVLATENDVLECWTNKNRVESIQCGDWEGSSLDELSPGEVPDQDAPVEIRSKARQNPSRQTDRLGRFQQTGLLGTAAALAELKLSETAEPPAAQLDRLERFTRDVRGRTPPMCRISIESANANALLAAAGHLLWEVVDSNGKLQTTADPLLLETCEHIIERQLSRLERDRRTAGAVSARLNEQARMLLS